jgi:hypothetical protein
MDTISPTGEIEQTRILNQDGVNIWLVCCIHMFSAGSLMIYMYYKPGVVRFVWPSISLYIIIMLWGYVPRSARGALLKQLVVLLAGLWLLSSSQDMGKWKVGRCSTTVNEHFYPAGSDRVNLLSSLCRWWSTGQYEKA